MELAFQNIIYRADNELYYRQRRVKNAQIHLEKARTAYKKELFGEAFGQSSAAMHNAENALGIIAKLETNRNSDNSTENEDRDIEDETDNDNTTGNNDATTNKERLCAQVITPAKNRKTGECREFPTACISQEWYKVRACEKNQIDSTDKNSDASANDISTE